MSFTKRLYSDIFWSLEKSFVRNSPIGQLSAGGKARSFYETIANELAKTYSDIDYNLTQSYLRFATGSFLDRIGEMFGVSRKQPASAYASSGDRVIRFYVEGGGTVGSINTSNPIYIPAGTKLYGNNTAFEVVEQSVFDASSTGGYVSAVSTLQGLVGNIDKDQLTTHDFSFYTGAASDSLKVTNDFSIVSGEDTESDANYRYRISKRLQSLEASNLTSIYSSILILPNVKDIRVVKHENGIGTTTIYLYSISPDISPGLIEAAQAEADRLCSAGEVVIIKPASNVKISFKTKISFQTNRISGIDKIQQMSSVDKTAVVDIARKAVLDYFRTRGIDDVFSIEKLIGVIIGSHASITDIGSFSNASSFDEILVWKTFGDREYSQYLQKDYFPSIGEYITIKSLELYT